MISYGAATTAKKVDLPRSVNPNKQLQIDHSQDSRKMP